MIKILKFVRIFCCFIIPIFGITPVLIADDIQRNTYKITVPDGSTIDPEDSDFDLDHFMVINFPDKNFLIIFVVDDQKDTEDFFQAFKKGKLELLKAPSESTSDMINENNDNAILLNGKLNGMKYCFEMGWITSNSKGIIFMAGYPKNEQKNAKNYTKTVVRSLKVI